MSGGQMVPYTEAPRAQQLKSPDWPADVVTPAMLTAYRPPFVSRSELYVLSPEAVHGVALEYLAKRDETTPLRTYGPLGANLAALCQSLPPR
eukprot:469124-Alexandrium_andersonii.AAC.1